MSMRSLARRLGGRVLRRVAPDLVESLELPEYVRRWVVPRNLETKKTPSYVSDRLVGHAGIEMHDGDQLERLKSWNESYQDVFKALREDPEINTWAHGKDFLHNGFYGTPDAEIYAAFIMDAKPRNIVEIGAGFSTLIARKAVDELSNHCRITTIDPAPRAEIGNAADTLISKCVEDVEPNEIPLHERALLFIDSSHIARSGGDVPYLYNRLIPVVPSGTLVHVDDIFIPYDYPHRYQKMLFTEQYVVHALLSHSNRCRIAFATHYMTRQYGEIMRDVLSRVVGKEDDYHGSSLWFWVED